VMQCLPIGLLLHTIKTLGSKSRTITLYVHPLMDLTSAISASKRFRGVWY
jgi:hypothetical protein